MTSMQAIFCLWGIGYLLGWPIGVAIATLAGSSRTEKLNSPEMCNAHPQEFGIQNRGWAYNDNARERRQ